MPGSKLPTHGPLLPDGSRLYTPEPVVSFMARVTLEEYLRRRLTEEGDAGLRSFVDRLDLSGLRRPAAVEEALREVTVCDPACGDGAFLLGMLRHLVRLRTQLGDRNATDPDSALRLRREIIGNNLYGVELDPEAATITRSRLLSEAGLDGSPRRMLDGRILAGDSLAALDWPAAFPGPFQRGGFDVVLMNPPYLLSSRVSGAARQQFRRYLDRLRRLYGFSGDLYVYFFHLALEILKHGGVLGALTSGSFLINGTKEPLRRELLRHTLLLLMPLDSDLFPATVYPAITVLRRGQCADAGHELRYLKLGRGRLDQLGPDDIRSESTLKVAPAEYGKAFRALFFEPTQENRRLFGTFFSVSDGCEGSDGEVGELLVGGRRFVRLGQVAPALDTGIHSGNVRDRLFHHDLDPGRKLYRLLQGAQVVRYSVWWENPQARYRYVDVDYRPNPDRKGAGRGGRPSGRGEYWHFCGSEENHRAPERLLMRQTADEPFVGYIRQADQVVYTDNTIHILLLTDRARELGLSYRYLLAILNSETVRRIYRAIAQEEGRVLAQVKVTLANRLPVPVPEEAERTELENLVGEIESLYRTAGFPLPGAVTAQLIAIQRRIDEQVESLYAFGTR